MNHKISASLLVASLFLLPATGFAATATVAEKSSTATTTEYVKDSVITTKVKAELAAEKMSSLVDITVDTDKSGMVVLGGTTTTQKGSDKAVAITKAVKGVTSVKNDIKVVPAK